MESRINIAWDSMTLGRHGLFVCPIHSYSWLVWIYFNFVATDNTARRLLNLHLLTEPSPSLIYYYSSLRLSVGELVWSLKHFILQNMIDYGILWRYDQKYLFDAHLLLLRMSIEDLKLGLGLVLWFWIGIGGHTLQLFVIMIRLHKRGEFSRVIHVLQLSCW
jgi:hypothetical protein